MYTLASIFILLSSFNVELKANEERSAGQILRIVEEARAGNTPYIEEYFSGQGFETISKGQITVPGGLTIDSLVMYNESSFEYLSLRKVDLEYLKNIELTMTLASENESWRNTINEFMMDSSLDIVSNDIEKEVIFVDNRKIIIEDDRWEKSTYAQFEKTKKYQLTNLDGYIDYHIKETVPQKYEIVLKDQLAVSDN